MLLQYYYKYKSTHDIYRIYYIIEFPIIDNPTHCKKLK